MHIESFRDFCLNLPYATEDFPFGKEVLVLKVGGKIFALTNLEDELFKVNLKCNPEKAIEYRERHSEIVTGYHMNKKHWNTVDFNGNLKDDFLEEMIIDSYNLVYKSLTKKIKTELES